MFVFVVQCESPPHLLFLLFIELLCSETAVKVFTPFTKVKLKMRKWNISDMLSDDDTYLPHQL